MPKISGTSLPVFYPSGRAAYAGKMHMLTYRMVNLRNLIIALSVGSVVVTATVLLTLVYQFQSNDFGKNMRFIALGMQGVAAAV